MALDLNRADELSEAADAILVDMFTYKIWNQEQAEKGTKVGEALLAAARVLIQEVPPCPDRTVALRKLRECRMDSNSAISFGKY